MKFGDWELFRCLIEMLRNMEMQQLQQQQQHDPTSSSDMNQSLTATNLFNSANESTVTGREPSPKPRFQTNSASGVLESAAEKAKRLASDSCNTLAGNSMESMNNISSIGLFRSQQQQQQQQQPYIPSTTQMMKAISKEQEMDFKNFNISKQQQQQQQQLQQQQPIPPQSLSLFTKPQQNYQLSLQQQQLMRQDSFVNEVMMEAEALINIVEATGVETNSESDESEDGDAGAGEGGHRTGAISPIPEEDTLSNPIQTSSHSSFVSLAKHAVLSRQASQDSATNIGDRAFFVGPDNDSGESDSEEVERLSHKNSVMRRQQTTKSPHHSVAGDVAASVAASAAAAATTTTTGAGCIVIGNASSGINDANYQVNRDSKKTALKRPDLTRASTDSTAPLLNRTYSEDASHALVFNNSFAVSGLNGTDASEANNSGYKSAFVTLNSGIIFQPTSLKSDQKELENKDEQDSSYKITIDF
ncbi:hypothetical protein HELRODRAFT_189249, partial [Helobdella robusta]|uniref:Uncharacterized protein n=1 Tax=Helobdella robusta TaxID=6412 RepID=T1FQV3_HELRO